MSQLDMSHTAFARVDPFVGLVAHSPEVLGMAHCLDSPDQSPRPLRAYCFKLNLTPTSVIANAIARTPMTMNLIQSLTQPVQMSLGNSRKTKVDAALSALLASNMQPW
jgi:hypothetical protein